MQESTTERGMAPNTTTQPQRGTQAQRYDLMEAQKQN